MKFYGVHIQKTSHSSGRKTVILRVFMLCILPWLGMTTKSVAAPGVPEAQLDNGVLHVTFYLPDAANGFYRGTRFDWSGVIADLTFAGHSFYGPWFTDTDPKTRDYVYTGPDITAGPSSAVTGPAEEFLNEDGTGLGFSQAASGQTFVKIGVGILRKPDDQKYSPYRSYDIVNPAQWKVRIKATSIEFTQKIIDKSSGYGYLYTKTIRLVPGQPLLIMEHSLKNLGRLPIHTNVYDHNFLVLDHQTIGPDFTVGLPFQIQPEKPIKTELGVIEADHIHYRKQLVDRENFTVHILGFGKTAQDNDIRIENSRAGVGMRITGDQPLLHEELWSIRSTLAMEPFIQLNAAPGETIHWTYTYLYYALPRRN